MQRIGEDAQSTTCCSLTQEPACTCQHGVADALVPARLRRPVWPQTAGSKARRSQRGRRVQHALEALPPEQQGGPSDQGGGPAGSEAAETVSSWLQRHGRDPAELERQGPVWAALEGLLGSRQAAVELVRREPLLLSMTPAKIESNVKV